MIFLIFQNGALALTFYISFGASSSVFFFLFIFLFLVFFLFLLSLSIPASAFLLFLCFLEGIHHLLLCLKHRFIHSELVVEVKYDFSIIIYREYIDQVVPITYLSQLLSYPVHSIF